MVPDMTCDPNYFDDALLLHLDGTNESTTILDSSQYGAVWSMFGGSFISTTESMFGGASLLCPGTSSQNQPCGATGPQPVAGGPFDFGIGDFTIEGWFYPLDTHDINSLIVVWSCGDFDTGTGHRVFIAQPQSGNTVFGGVTYQNFEHGGTWVVNGPLNTGDNCIVNGWNHFAVVRYGNVLQLYVNGVGGAVPYTIVDPTVPAITFDSGTNITLGYDSFSGIQDTYFDGYIDEVRVTKGLARYTANFTAPTAAFGQSCIPSAANANAFGNFAGAKAFPPIAVANFGDIQPRIYMPQGATTITSGAKGNG